MAATTLGRISENKTLSPADIFFESVFTIGKAFEPGDNQDKAIIKALFQIIDLAALLIYIVEKLLRVFNISIKDTEIYNITKFRLVYGFSMLTFLKYIKPTKTVLLLSLAVFVSVLFLFSGQPVGNSVQVTFPKLEMALLVTALAYIFLILRSDKKWNRAEEVEARMGELREEFELGLN
jgi:hypothetical protein